MSKHPLFKKDEPELMKSMKFGQKGDCSRPGPSAVSVPQPAPSATVAASSASELLVHSRELLAHSQSPNNLSLSAIQGTQSAQHLALLRTLANSQNQLSRMDAGDHLASQVLAMGGLSGASEYENQLRNRLLLAGLPSTLPSFHRPGSALATQPLQGFAGGDARNLSRFNERILGLPEIRSTSLFGSTLPGSADLQRSLALSARGTAHGSSSASTSALDPFSTGFGATARSIPNSLLDAGNISSQSQPSTSNASIGGSQYADSLRLLRLQQASGRQGDASAELLMLIEQERQRKQNEQG